VFAYQSGRVIQMYFQQSALPSRVLKSKEIGGNGLLKASAPPRKE